PSKDDGCLCHHAEADPGLFTGDHVRVAFTLGAAREVGGVGTHTRLGQSESNDLFTPRARWEPAGLDLLARVVSKDLACQSRELDAVGRAEITPRNLLHGDSHAHQVDLAATVLDCMAKCEQPKLAYLPPRCPRKLTAFVPLARAWRQLLAGEGAERPNQLVLLRGKGEVHTFSVAATSSCSRRSR